MIPPSILKPVELIPLLSISSSAGVRDLTFVESVQTDFETDRASYSVGKAGPCFRVKQPGRVAAHSPPSVVEFKKTGVILLLPTYAVMSCAGTNLPLLFIHCVVRLRQVRGFFQSEFSRECDLVLFLQIPLSSVTNKVISGFR
jgi:hypothetical protein